MKKIYTLVAVALASASFSFAQRSATKTTLDSKVQINKSHRAPTGMLTSHFDDGTPTLYKADVPGFVSGSNDYYDWAKGQQFNLTSGTSYAIEGVAIYFGSGKYVSNNANSKVVVTIWDMDGTGASNAGSVAGPGTVLGSVDVAMSTIATDVTAQQLTSVNFASPITVSGNYVIGIDMQTLAANDTVGIVSTTDGDYANDELSWEQWDGGDWYTIDAAWGGLKINLAVFPLVVCQADLTGGASVVNGSCNTMASAEVMITNANGGVMYAWMNAANDTVSTSATALNLDSDDYTIEVEDEVGCTFTGNVTVTNVDPIVITEDSIVNASSSNATDGSITVTVSGGSGTLSYAWSPSGGTAATATDLAAGTYTVTVSDTAGCQSSATYTVSFASGINVNAGSEIAITPNPASSVINFSFVANSVASVKLFNITGEVVYTETVGKGVYKSAINVSELSNGVYFLQVIEGNNVSTKKVVKN